MKLNPSEFISKAEGLKSYEINTRQHLESIRSQRSSVQSQIETLEYRLDSLYMELESLQDDEDEETDNSAAIASVRAEISSTKEEISDYEVQDAKLGIEEFETEEELRQIELEEQETLADIQDSATRTNKNIALISSFSGDYANVSAQATNSFQHNLGQLSKSAQILGGSVAMGTMGNGGGYGGSYTIQSNQSQSGRNFYEAANNQRNNSSANTGSFGTKGSSGKSTGRNQRNLYNSEAPDNENTHSKSGGLGRKSKSNSQAIADKVAQEYNKKYSPVSRAIARGYTDVKETPNGGISFEDSKSLYITKDGKKGIVRIQATGNRTKDFDLANEALGLEKKPDGYTWHHVDDYNVVTNTMTLELVDSTAHNAAKPHSGACAQFDAVNGSSYNPPNSTTASKKINREN